MSDNQDHRPLYDSNKEGEQKPYEGDAEKIEDTIGKVTPIEPVRRKGITFPSVVVPKGRVPKKGTRFDPEVAEFRVMTGIVSGLEEEGDKVRVLFESGLSPK